MQEVKTAGLVLSSANLNDNDRIFTIQTRDIAKCSFLRDDHITVAKILQSGKILVLMRTYAL